MTHPKLAVARSGWGGRGYKIPNLTDEDGKHIILPSVTTVLKRVNKEALYQWVADTTAAYAVANLGRLTELSEEVGWGMLRWHWSNEPELVGGDLRQHYMGVRDDAAELGTNIHEWIEWRIDMLSGPEPQLDSLEAEEMATVFEVWLEDHEVISHAQEFTVHDRRVAGTADADWSIRCLHIGPCLGQPAGEFRRALIDLKSSRHTWPEHGMQVAFLRAAPFRMVEVDSDSRGAMLHEKTENGRKVRTWWRQVENFDFQSAALLHIRPRDLTTQGDPIPAFCEVIDVTADLDVYADGFDGAYALAKMMRTLRLRQKARHTQEVILDGTEQH